MGKLRNLTNIEICENNGLKNTLLTNVVEEKSTINKIKSTLDMIAKTVCGTLGPYGSTTIIQDREKRHFATKDGYDLMNRISFQDEVSATILDMIRQVAANQVQKVGDGSTSSIVVADALFSALTNRDDDSKLKFDRIASKDIVDILNYLSDYIEEHIQELSIPINENFDKLETIAAIATNNDKETGQFIKDIYKITGKYGFITTNVLNNKEKDSYEIKTGIEWERGYIDPKFDLQNSKKIVYELDEENNSRPIVFLSNSVLTYDDIESFIEALLVKTVVRNKNKLLIVANGFDEDIKYFLTSNRTKHLLPGKRDFEMDFTAVDIDQVTATNRDNLEDLSFMLGCEIFDKTKHTGKDFKDNPERFLGKSDKIVVTQNTTQILSNSDLSEENNLKLEDHIKLLSEELDKLINDPEIDETDFDIYELKRRMSSFNNSSVIIDVGGKSQTERMTRERLIEDAIYAAKSAIKSGYIPGGNITVPRLLKIKKEELVKDLSKRYFYFQVDSVEDFFNDFIELLIDTFLVSYRHVLENSYFTEDESEDIAKKCLKENTIYNMKLHKYENIEDTSVINSTNTDIEIMKSCFSIVGILATSNQMITLNLCISDAIK